MLPVEVVGRQSRVVVVAPHGERPQLARDPERARGVGPLRDNVAEQDQSVPPLGEADFSEEFGQIVGTAVDVPDKDEAVAAASRRV